MYRYSGRKGACMQQEICFYSPDALAQARIPADAAAPPPSTRCCLSIPAAAAGNERSRFRNRCYVTINFLRVGLEAAPHLQSLRQSCKRERNVFIKSALQEAARRLRGSICVNRRTAVCLSCRPRQRRKYPMGIYFYLSCFIQPSGRLWRVPRL